MLSAFQATGKFTTSNYYQKMPWNTAQTDNYNNLEMIRVVRVQLGAEDSNGGPVAKCCRIIKF